MENFPPIEATIKYSGNHKKRKMTGKIGKSAYTKPLKRPNPFVKYAGKTVRFHCA